MGSILGSILTAGVRGGECFGIKSGSSSTIQRSLADPLSASEFTVGRPALFEDTYERNVPAPSPYYDVSLDGQRFLMITETEAADDTSGGNEPVLVLNWHEELKRLVPVSIAHLSLLGSRPYAPMMDLS